MYTLNTIGWRPGLKELSIYIDLTVEYMNEYMDLTVEYFEFCYNH